MKYFRLKLFFFIYLLLSVSSFAAGPGTGNMTKFNIKVDECKVSAINVKWKLDSMMGESIVNGLYKWDSNEKCSLPISTAIYLKIEDYSGKNGYIKIQPTVPKANSGYGFNVSGSPPWSKAIIDFGRHQNIKYQSPSDAKYLWKNGEIVDFIIKW